MRARRVFQMKPQIVRPRGTAGQPFILQNERLTCRTARPDDLWFHLKNAPGSHVILRTSEHAGSVTAHAVECAAALAAWYSSARNTNKADVDYTKMCIRDSFYDI